MANKYTNTQQLMGVLSRIWPGYNRTILQTTLENLVWVLKMHGGVTNVNQMVHFLAQTGHETAGYKTLREYGNRKYFERYRNHSLKIWEDNEPKWIGRGHIQITGKTNYMLIQGEIGHDYDILTDPSTLEKPEVSLIASAHWWRVKGCNRIADTNDVVALTKRINGGHNGLKERIKYYEFLSIVFKDMQW